MKKSFIPSEYRPDIAGSKTIKSHVSYLDVFKDHRRRHHFIKAFYTGTKEIPGIDADWAKRILETLYPSLRSLQ
jgi:hypothetical protein